MKAISRLALLACAAVALALPSCQSDWSNSFFGYQAGQAALYDTCIHTVRVPIFQNHTLLRQGIEFDLTRAVVREINLKTPYKVVGADADADTELAGTIITFTKGTLNVNPLNEIREQETDLTVELSWRNLRTGEALSDPTRRTQRHVRPGVARPAGRGADRGRPRHRTAGHGLAADAARRCRPSRRPRRRRPGPDGKPIYGPDGKLPANPAGRARSSSLPLGDFIPELGQSLTTAQKQNVDRMAVQIVSMMEKPW